MQKARNLDMQNKSNWLRSYLSIRIGEKTQQVRKSTGPEHGLNASFKAAGEAAKGSGGLDKNRGAVVGSGGEKGDDGRDGAELDVGELLGAVADDLILDLP